MTKFKTGVWCVVLLLFGLTFVIEWNFYEEQISSIKQRFHWSDFDNTRIFQNDTGNLSAMKILILTYMRSGSTFTGDIMQQDPQSFYLFEPFRVISHSIREKKVLFNMNGTKWEHRNFTEVAAEILDNFFQCKFEEITRNVWVEDFFLGLSLKAKHFWLCMGKYRTPAIKNGTYILTRCLKELKSECLKSKFIVIKTIRLSMDLIKPMMQKYKNMKIIHLIRDPRNTIASQIRIVGTNKLGRPAFANNICTRILTDIEDYNLLKDKYPNRLTRVSYESLACNPLDISRTLYKFCGMNFTENVVGRIRTLTENSVEKNDIMGIVKSNSCATAYGRLKTIPNINLLEQNSCYYLLHKLKLHPFTDIEKT